MFGAKSNPSLAKPQQLYGYLAPFPFGPRLVISQMLALPARILVGSFCICGLLLHGGCEQRGPAPAGSPSPQDPTNRSRQGARVERFAAVPRPPNPNHSFNPVDNRIAIARQMLRAARYDQAELALKTILATHPGDAQSTFLLAAAIQKQKRYTEARALFEQVISTNVSFPEVDSVFYLLGWSAYYLGDLPLAQDAFHEHLRRAPNEADSVYGLGIIALDQDRLDDAERLLRQSQSMQGVDPRSVREVAKAHARLGDVFIRRGDLQEAERQLQSAVRLFPDHYEAWAKLARVMERLNRPEDAQAARAQEQDAMRRVGRLGPGSNQDGALPPWR
jgi:tetratricopeptide (TPR) repeat protein